MKHYSLEEDMIPLGEFSDEGESDISSDNEISLDHLDEDITESDSDSSPETFSFSVAQEKRKEAKKLTADAVRQQKIDLKRKRKEVLVQNLKQREEKRKKIESKRLPEHVLENLDDEFHIDITSDKLEETKEIEKDNEEKEIITMAGNVTFKCKVLPIEAQKPKFVPEKVANFKDTMLYGGRIRREKSNRDAVLKKEKQHIKR